MFVVYPYSREGHINYGYTLVFPAGEPAIAAGSGVVASVVNRLPDWQYTEPSDHQTRQSFEVIIDHGHEVFSVISGLQSVAVVRGEVVQRGQVVGLPVTTEVFFGLRWLQKFYDPASINRHFTVQNRNEVAGQGNRVRFAPDKILRDLSGGFIKVLFGTVGFFVDKLNRPTPLLINVDFNGSGSKTGPAATGRSPDDFWNVFAPMVYTDPAMYYGNACGEPEELPSVSQVTISPDSVIGSGVVTGTVFLSRPAPAGGMGVALHSNSVLAAVPAGVVVPEGATSVDFPITTSPVGTDTTVNITAILNALTQTATLTITPPVLVGVMANPSVVTGGGTSTGTVFLGTPAPAGGIVVSLSSDLAAATVPATVTVPEGATSANFAITTTVVLTDTVAFITATLGSVSQTATLSLVPVTVVSEITFDPASVIGGESSTGTILLNRPAALGGLVVVLSSDSASATVPPTVTVPENSATVNFVVNTTAVAVDTNIGITGTLNAFSKTSTLMVTAPVLFGVTINPASVVGGVNATGTVLLDTPAPVGGIVVSLSSDSVYAFVPPEVTVLENATSANFIVETTAVGVNTNAIITATLNAVSKTATLLVTAPVLTSVTVNPASLVGGGTSVGTVFLSTPSPAGGVSVALSDNSASVTVPVSVLVPAGATQASFAIETVAVGVNTSVIITGTLNAVNKTATLTVTAPVLTDVTVNPNSVIGGASSTGTVFLSSAAPAGGVVVALSDNSVSATVPASVTVPGGATSATFAVTTIAVTSNTVVFITATFNSIVKTAALAIASFEYHATGFQGDVRLERNGALTGAVDTKQFTFSTWFKKTDNDGLADILFFGDMTTNPFVIQFNSDNTILCTVRNASGTVICQLKSTVAFPKTESFWFHLFVSANLANPADSKLFIDGVPSHTQLVFVNENIPWTFTGTGADWAIGMALDGSLPLHAKLCEFWFSTTYIASPAAFRDSATPAGPADLGPTGSVPGVTPLIYLKNPAATFQVNSGTGGNFTVMAGTPVNEDGDLPPSPPPALQAIIVPASAPGGSIPVGTVVLTRAAPAGGAVVEMSSNSDWVTVGAVTVPAGATSANFFIVTFPTPVDISVVLTGTYNAVQTATFTLTAPVLFGVTLNPVSAIGGTNPKGTVTLNSDAPEGGTVVSLSSDSSSVIVPATVTVPEGVSSVEFTITTLPVGANIIANITAVAGSVSQSAILNVTTTALARNSTTGLWHRIFANSLDGKVYFDIEQTPTTTTAGEFAPIFLRHDVSGQYHQINAENYVDGSVTSVIWSLNQTGVAGPKLDAYVRHEVTGQLHSFRCLTQDTIITPYVDPISVSMATTAYAQNSTTGRWHRIFANSLDGKVYFDIEQGSSAGVFVPIFLLHDASGQYHQLNAANLVESGQTTVVWDLNQTGVAGPKPAVQVRHEVTGQLHDLRCLTLDTFVLPYINPLPPNAVTAVFALNSTTGLWHKIFANSVDGLVYFDIEQTNTAGSFSPVFLLQSGTGLYHQLNAKNFVDGAVTTVVWDLNQTGVAGPKPPVYATHAVNGRLYELRCLVLDAVVVPRINQVGITP